MEESASTKKFTSKKILGGIATLFTLVGTIITVAARMHNGDAILRAVEGTWTLKTQTTETTETRFRDMELTYTVSLTRDGIQVKGKGLKLGEKSAGGIYTDCKANACTAFDINGSLDADGDSWEAWFTDEGERSTTHLHLNKNGKSWVGTFTSEAGTPSGPATWSGTATLSPF